MGTYSGLGPMIAQLAIICASKCRLSMFNEHLAGAEQALQGPGSCAAVS